MQGIKTCIRFFVLAVTMGIPEKCRKVGTGRDLEIKDFLSKQYFLAQHRCIALLYLIPMGNFNYVMHRKANTHAYASFQHLIAENEKRKWTNITFNCCAETKAPSGGGLRKENTGLEPCA